jgi:hypothetical protein
VAECAWRPKRRAQPWWSGPITTTYARPRLPFVRSHQGRLVHRIRYWSLVWERQQDGQFRLRNAYASAWCGSGSGTRGHAVAADVRLIADSADELCRRCFACEVVDQVWARGHLAA